MNAIALLVALVTSTTGPQVNAEQFAQLINGLHADCHDVSMIFEGENKLVGTGRNIVDLAEHESQYQGHYAFRSDGATLLDTYTHYTIQKKSTYAHDIMASLGQETKIANASPDVRRFNYASNKRVAGQYDRPGSLQAIFFLSYFRELGDLGHRGYEDQGWEDVAGHRCFRVQIDDYFDSNGAANRHYQRFWIDMVRGGHPLKVEAYWGTQHVSTVDDVRLVEFPTVDGKKFWLPVTGKTLSFLGTKGVAEAKPTVAGTFMIVTNSVRINDGLKDDIFRVDRKGGLPETREIRRLRDLFDSAPLPRSDAAGVKAHLDRALKEADAQSERLEASSPAREGWSVTTAAQLGLASVGCCLLSGVGYRRWRDR